MKTLIDQVKIIRTAKEVLEMKRLEVEAAAKTLFDLKVEYQELLIGYKQAIDDSVSHPDVNSVVIE